MPVLWPDAGRWSIYLLFAAIVVLLMFRSTAQIDLAVSDWFFTERDCATAIAAAEEVRCGRFLLVSDKMWIGIREIGHDLPRVLMAVVCLHLTWLMMFNPNKTMAQLYPPLVAIISALVGPLLVVNLVLKEYWGRPRPFRTEFFGGDNPYVAPGDISTYCDANCSFVSGEAAAGFWLLALMFYFTGQSRKRYVIAAIILASAIAFLRVIFGRHYISDVVVAGLIVAVVMSFTVWLLQTELVRRLLAAMLKFSNTYAFGRRNMKN